MVNRQFGCFLPLECVCSSFLVAATHSRAESAPLGWKNMEWAVGETLGELGVSPADVDAEV